MDLSTIDQGIATQIGHYADAIVIPAGYDQILVSGTPGLDQDGDLAPDIVGQSEQAWENVTRILDAAGASISDIVFIRQWLTHESDVAGYVGRTIPIRHPPARSNDGRDPHSRPARIPPRTRSHRCTPVAR